jgi:sugar O-acyltransferase (sialic acid O-acetyltransferase NeuD family)
MKDPVIIVGTTALAHQALEILLQNDIVVYGFLAEKQSSELTEINHIPILGNIEDDTSYLEKIDKRCAIFIAMEQATIRQQYIKKLNKQYEANFVNLIHPLANLAFNVQLGIGNLIDAGTNISAHTQLGNHCLVHKQVIIEYGTTIQNFVQIGSGSIIGEQVTIEEDVFIGPAVTIVAGTHIEKGARIGSGSVVLESVKENEVMLGNPAKPFYLK